MTTARVPGETRPDKVKLEKGAGPSLSGPHDSRAADSTADRDPGLLK